MVKRLIARILIEVLSTVGKSAMKAYKETAAKQSGNGKKANPIGDFLTQAMQTANLTHKPMNRSDALKILHIEENELKPEQVMQNFWKQFHKNDPTKGGSFYLQSMIFNAKQELFKEFPEANEQEIIKTLGLETPEEKEKAEQAEKQKP